MKSCYKKYKYWNNLLLEKYLPYISYDELNINNIKINNIKKREL